MAHKLIYLEKAIAGIVEELESTEERRGGLAVAQRHRHRGHSARRSLQLQHWRLGGARSLRRGAGSAAGGRSGARRAAEGHRGRRRRQRAGGRPRHPVRQRRALAVQILGVARLPQGLGAGTDDELAYLVKRGPKTHELRLPLRGGHALGLDKGQREAREEAAHLQAPTLRVREDGARERGDLRLREAIAGALVHHLHEVVHRDDAIAAGVEGADHLLRSGMAAHELLVDVCDDEGLPAAPLLLRECDAEAAEELPVVHGLLRRACDPALAGLLPRQVVTASCHEAFHPPVVADGPCVVGIALPELFPELRFAL
mmetsp:Transcript_78234/g.241447  ORF Transcript_78234/g.241447 Transcript_78234/m.241447 type:complete len:314 (+) Transcript_78234:489-1430(+)